MSLPNWARSGVALEGLFAVPRRGSAGRALLVCGLRDMPMKSLIIAASFLFISAGLLAQTAGNSFKGLYLGTFSNGDQFAMIVSSKTDTSIYIVGRVTHSVGRFTNFTIGTDGGFALNQSDASIVAKITNGTVAGTVPQKNQTLSGRLVSQSGGYGGYYIGLANDQLGHQAGCVFIVATDGRVFYYLANTSGANGAVGNIDAQGHITLTDANGISGTATFSTPIEGGGYSGTVNIPPVGLLTFYVSKKGASYKMINISTLGEISNGGVLTAGFVISGGARRVLIRASGPALTAFNVSNVLADPRLTVIDNDTGSVIATNDDWVSADISQSAAAVGAFAFPIGSKDAALLLTLEPGAYSAQIRGANNAGGATIVEVYDAD